MILTQIEVPVLSASYDCRLDENLPVRSLIGEILKILEIKAGREEENDWDAAGFVLCSIDKEQVLPSSETLRECGIRNGEQLLLL